MHRVEHEQLARSTPRSVAKEPPLTSLPCLTRPRSKNSKRLALPKLESNQCTWNNNHGCVMEPVDISCTVPAVLNFHTTLWYLYVYTGFQHDWSKQRWVHWSRGFKRHASLSWWALAVLTIAAFLEPTIANYMKQYTFIPTWCNTSNSHPHPLVYRCSVSLLCMVYWWVLVSVAGQEPGDAVIDGMMNEAPGPLNFTMFLTLFGEKLTGESGLNWWGLGVHTETLHCPQTVGGVERYTV